MLTDGRIVLFCYRQCGEEDQSLRHAIEKVYNIRQERIGQGSFLESCRGEEPRRAAAEKLEREVQDAVSEPVEAMRLDACTHTQGDSSSTATATATASVKTSLSRASTLILGSWFLVLGPPGEE